VVTADRPPELRDVGAPQTIDQIKLFGAAVRWAHDPGVPSQDAAASWRPLARHVVDETLGAVPGPVHLNLSFREPLIGTAGDLAPSTLGPRAVLRLRPEVHGIVSLCSTRRGVIVAGAGIDDPGAVAHLAEVLGWPVFADPRSGVRGTPNAVAAFDALLRVPAMAARRPDVVFHLGEPPASKLLAQWSAGLGVPQVRMIDRPVTIDPASVVTHRVIGPIGAACDHIRDALVDGLGAATVDAPGTADDRADDWADDWLEGWRSAERDAQAVLADALDGDVGGAGVALDEPTVARAMTAFEGTLVVASSMPVRDVEWYGRPDQRAVVVSNRGANGIDGTVATAIGVAATTGRPTAVLLGDVALLHDQSSLTALARRDVDVRIVVVDNDGGGIFSFLSQAEVLHADRFEQLFGTPHGTDLVRLGEAHDLRTTAVSDLASLRAALDEPGPSLTVVRTDRARNVEVHRALHAAVADRVDGTGRIGR
jgi:2-succinyl-5-enolpyruvyl-6-hydroxy-3-cyclohexene-1-carboxylate synthase